MGDAADATRGADEILGPALSGAYASTTSALTTTASAIDITGSTPGGRMVTFQARGGTAYIRFRPDNAATVTASDSGAGYKLIDGARFDKWIDTNERYCDAIGSASMSLYWWVSSPNYRNRS